MNRLYRFLATGLVAAAISSCTFAGRDVSDPHLDAKAEVKGAFVYGYIDMQDAKSDLNWAFLKQTEPKVFDPDFTARTFKSAFYLENLPQGTFRLNGFGGNTWSFFHAGRLFATYPVDYELQLASNVSVDIRKPGIYYLGAFRYVRHKGGFLEDDTFELKRASTPSERDVLQIILPEASGSPWAPLLTNRLSHLK